MDQNPDQRNNRSYNNGPERKLHTQGEAKQRIQKLVTGSSVSYQLASSINNDYQEPSQGSRITHMSERSIQSEQMIIQNHRKEELTIFEEESEDCNQRLILILKVLKNNLFLAVDLANTMLEDIKHGELEVKEQEIDASIIKEIKQELDIQETTLGTILIRVLLSERLSCFQLQDRMNIGLKALEQLAKGPSNYGEYLLIFFLEHTDQQLWLNALKAQQYKQVPLTLLNYLLEKIDVDIEFAMHCLTNTKAGGYSEDVITIILNNLKKQNVEAIIVKSIDWALLLSMKSEQYCKGFFKKGILQILKKAFYNLEDCHVEFLELATKFVDWMVQMRIDENIIHHLINSEFVKIYDFNQKLKLSSEAYNNLYFLLDSIQIQYPNQLKDCLLHSDWYQDALIELILQKEVHIVNVLATEKMKHFLTSNSKGFFQKRIELRQDRELDRKLGLH